MRRLIPGIIILITVFFSYCRAQNENSILSPAFHLQKRDSLREMLPPFSAAVFFSGGYRPWDPESDRAIPFRVDPDFFYLTGHSIPNSVLVIFSEPVAWQSKRIGEIIFYPHPGEEGLISRGDLSGFTGSSLPKGELKTWAAFCSEVLASDSLKRIFVGPGYDYDLSGSGKYSYREMRKTFFNSLVPGFPVSPGAEKMYVQILDATNEQWEEIAEKAKAAVSYFPELESDPVLRKATLLKDGTGLEGLKKQIEGYKFDLGLLGKLMAGMREIKDEEEAGYCRGAGELASVALVQGIQMLRPGTTEERIAAEIFYAAGKGSGTMAAPIRIATGSHTAYPVFTPGPTACKTGEIAVLDVSLRKKGYCARAGRTLPVSGKFGKEDRQLYGLLVDAHETLISGAKPGATFSAVSTGASGGLESSLLKSGLLGDKKNMSQVILSTGLFSTGLSISDPRASGQLRAGMILVAESALYFPDHKSIPEGIRGRGFLICDTIRITTEGNQILTRGLPLQPGEVEAAMSAR